MSSILLITALLAGALFAIQPGINSLVASHLGNPLLASLLSFAVGLFLLISITITLQVPLPPTAKMSALPWWLWVCGGAIGAVVVTIALVVAPQIGAAAWISFFVTGQLLLSIALDHFGWLGFAVHPLNVMRSLGAFFLVLGVILIARF
ncbi:MAG: DMT family transporter [Cyanophyceae cyanobacterium]